MRMVLTVDLARVTLTRCAVPDSGAVTDAPEVWTSEELPIGFPATQLVPSWTARTPPGAWIEVELRARTAGGRLTKWYVMGRWSEHGRPRTSVAGQGDGDGDVAVDTFVARRPVVAFQARVTRHGQGHGRWDPSCARRAALATRVRGPRVRAVFAGLWFCARGGAAGDSGAADFP